MTAHALPAEPAAKPPDAVRTDEQRTLFVDADPEHPVRRLLLVDARNEHDQTARAGSAWRNAYR